MSDMGMVHTKWDCTYHIVFIPKYRRKVLYGEVRQKLLVIMKRLCRNKGIEIVEGGGDVHRSCAYECKDTSETISSRIHGLSVKGKSALMLFDENSELRRRTGKDRTVWARGYYVSTVGLNEEVIRNYIRSQEESDQFADGK